MTLVVVAGFSPRSSNIRQMRAEARDYNHMLFNRMAPLCVLTLISGPPAPILKSRLLESMRPVRVTGKSDNILPREVSVCKLAEYEPGMDNVMPPL